MRNRVQLSPLVGLLATVGLAGFMGVQLDGQQATVAPADYTKAVFAEVQDAQGLVVLRGEFALADEEDDDVERKATLAPTGVDADATGAAEVEFARTSPAVHEVEFTARNLQAGATFTFVIDGADVATATADRRGNAEIELEVGLPRPSAR
jgi:hypothetical protein